MSLRPADPGLSPGARAPLIPKLRGQFADFPLPRWSDRPWPSQPARLCWFSVRSPGIVPRSLFTVPWLQPEPHKRPHHAFSRLSPLRYSAAFSAWTGRRYPPAPAWPSQRCWERSLRCRTYPGGAGILTGFPFGGYELRAALGPTNCWLTKHRQQTLALSALGIPTPVCCYYRRDPRSIRVHRSSRPDFYPVWTPAYPAPSSEEAARVSAPGFSPDSFSGPPSSAGELLRTL